MDPKVNKLKRITVEDFTQWLEDNCQSQVEFPTMGGRSRFKVIYRVENRCLEIVNANCQYVKKIGLITQVVDRWNELEPEERTVVSNFGVPRWEGCPDQVNSLYVAALIKYALTKEIKLVNQDGGEMKKSPVENLTTKLQRVNVNYSIEEHNHRLAAWAAGTAASASSLCRFKVSLGKEILENIGLNSKLNDSNELPIPEELDCCHEKWRKSAIEIANNLGISGFTHGVAAKLINVYLKVRFVCANRHDNPNVKALHPPIDAVLLESLKSQNFGGRGQEWGEHHDARWSKYNSEQYQAVIDLIRSTLQEGTPLWKIEEFWVGHQ